jgi:co-chaperonin GroES (HSP10)
MENKSLYLEAFKRAEGTFKLYGSKILIERLDTGEVKTKSGLIIAESSSVRSDLRLQKPHVAMVLAVGSGYFDSETKEYTPLEVKPGNIVVVSSIGAQYYSLLPGLSDYSANKVGLTTEGDVQIIFESIEEFNKYEDLLSNNTNQ